MSGAKFWLWTAVSVGVVVRALFVFLTPYATPAEVGRLSSYNDERAHVAYTLFILEHARLPAVAEPITSDSALTAPTFENYQSPLYYLLHATVCLLASVDDERRVAMTGRWLSLLIGLGILFTAWRILHELHVSAPEAARLALTVLWSLSAVLVRFTTQSGNEALFWLLAGLMVWTFLKAERTQAARSIVLVGVIFVLGVYVKLSMLILLPLLFLLPWKAMRKPSHRVATVAGLMLVLLPLAMRNYVVFGAWIPLGAGFGEAAWRVPTLDTLLYLMRSLIFPWSELWRNWLGLLLMFPALAWLGGILAAWLINFRSHPIWSYTLAATSVAAYLWLNLRYDQAEARYLLAAWPAVVPALAGFRWNASRLTLLVLALLLPYQLFFI